LIDVPRNIAGKEAINVRFTYDINGILEVEATVVSTGLKKSKLIVNGDLSEEEKNEKIKILWRKIIKYLNFNDFEIMKNEVKYIKKLKINNKLK